MSEYTINIKNLKDMDKYILDSMEKVLRKLIGVSKPMSYVIIKEMLNSNRTDLERSFFCKGFVAGVLMGVGSLGNYIREGDIEIVNKAVNEFNIKVSIMHLEKIGLIEIKFDNDEFNVSLTDKGRRYRSHC